MGIRRRGEKYKDDPLEERRMTSIERMADLRGWEKKPEREEKGQGTSGVMFEKLKD